MASSGASRIMAPWRKQLVQGFMAGAYVALGGLFANLMGAGFTYQGEGPAPYPGLPSFISGVVFPIGLIGIFLTGSNLYTGNCMYIVPPLIHGAVPRMRALGWLALSWISNFAGAMFVAYFIAYKGEWFMNEPAKSFVMHNAEKKCNLGWGVALLRGIGANWLVCLAWWQALSTNDTVGKILAVWWPVFAFTAIGFEHSIANMFYVDIGLLEGANCTFSQFVGHNLIPVTLGNLLGGFLFLGTAQYIAYDNGPIVAKRNALLANDVYEESSSSMGNSHLN